MMLRGEELERRRKRILEVIVEAYISTAQPVGSRAIARQFMLDLSPATIRNEMADLEELGYLRKPHNSAGRVPTDKGYRYYVDSLMGVRRLPSTQAARIAREYRKPPDGIGELMEKTSRILSSITHQAGMIIFPRLRKSGLKRLELVRMDSRKLLAVWTTTSGLMRDHVVNTKEDFASEEVRGVCNLLNRELAGLDLDEIRVELLKRMREERTSVSYLVRGAFEIIRHISTDEAADRLYLEGRNYILEQPEFFKDLDRAREVMAALEEKGQLLEILNEDSEREGVKVHIGKENRFKDIWECSIVTSNYRLEGKVVGTLGILGPKRMEYLKVVACVDHMAEVVGQALSRW